MAAAAAAAGATLWLAVPVAALSSSTATRPTPSLRPAGDRRPVKPDRSVRMHAPALKRHKHKTIVRRAVPYGICLTATTDADIEPKSDNDTAVPRAAFFDVDGTLMETNIVWPYVLMRLDELPFIIQLFWVPFFALQGIGFDRSLLNKIFFSKYKGYKASDAPAIADKAFTRYYKPRMIPRALEHIAELKTEGFRIVFVTGSLDFMMKPVADFIGVDAVMANELEVDDDGRFTGRLVGAPVSDGRKATLVHAWARQHLMDQSPHVGNDGGDQQEDDDERVWRRLQQCRAYGDSAADLPLLEAVGFPHAVAPDKRLRAIAEARGWPILEWARHMPVVSD
eukprot:jgi/Chlat1/2972/Chrsp2S04698